jgi:hypothetical protein
MPNGIVLFCLLCLLLPTVCACAVGSEDADGFHTVLTPTGEGIARRPTPCPSFSGRLESLPSYVPGEADPWQVQILGRDLTDLDLSGRLVDLDHAIFDSNTKWPAELPEPFDPVRYMDLGRNPGLGLRALHERGITGRGVAIAIVDQALLVDHTEYRDRLRLYEEIRCWGEAAEIHGPAVASIAVGKTVGVAPEADLYYIGTTFFSRSSPEGPTKRDLSAPASAIQRMLEINHKLPPDRRFRVLSISAGTGPSEPGSEEFSAAIAEAKEAGIFVVSSDLTQHYGFSFHGLGRDPLSDPEQPSSYHEPSFGGGFPSTVLRVPMDARCTASPTGPDDYAFYPQGGWSWAIPYIAGLYALACQTRPDITPDAFWKAALETGDPMPPAEASATSRSELEKRVAEMVDQDLTHFKQNLTPDALARHLAQVCTRLGGEPRDTVSEAEFRELAIKHFTDREMERRKTPGIIVNPARLIDHLQQSE